MRGEWGVRGERVGSDVEGGCASKRVGCEGWSGESEGEGGVCEGESVSGVSGGGGESWGVKGRVGCKGESGKELDVRV